MHDFLTQSVVTFASLHLSQERTTHVDHIASPLHVLTCLSVGLHGLYFLTLGFRCRLFEEFVNVRVMRCDCLIYVDVLCILTKIRVRHELRSYSVKEPLHIFPVCLFLGFVIHSRGCYNK